MTEADEGGCGHDQRSGAFVCQHLVRGEGLGFHSSDEEPDALWPDAWCGRCEAIVDEEGEWNEDAMQRADVDIRLICADCYMQARARNWCEPDGVYEELLERAEAAVQGLQEKLRSDFHLNDFPRWDWNQETGQLIFSGAPGRSKVIADFVFAGSISTRSNTWMWSWANESDSENVKAPLRRVRQVGQERGLLKLAAALWHGDEYDGWQVTAIAAYVLGAVGVYRTPAENGFSYLVLTNVRTEE